ncbi:MAG TPA: glycoside hydrolase family 2 protein, partial [Clostridiales bacterium]|nr:glycoside hydrolase family 2 protein [Clostridiales bacterium]
MRKTELFNDGWSFSKSSLLGQATPADLTPVTLPHTWNAVDGQDGGNDYYRGTCYYRKEVKKAAFPEGEKVYLEFRGTNSSATLYVNEKEVASHDGGYSTWRADITD